MGVFNLWHDTWLMVSYHRIVSKNFEETQRRDMPNYSTQTCLSLTKINIIK